MHEVHLSVLMHTGAPPPSLLDLYTGARKGADYKMGYIDLHVHSLRSDGSMTPKELVHYAVQKGLKAMALTDHDTVDGIDEIMEYAKDKPIEIIPGIEYSTEYHERDVHIVGLFIDHKAPVFSEYLARFLQSRTDRNHKLCANLRSAGIDITYEALLLAFPDAVITRAHYAKFLLDQGYVKSRNEAFERYLGDHTPYFVHREKITPEEVIDVTRQAGGIPVLAHPALYGLGNEQLDLLVKRLKAAGLMGIETFYSTYTFAEEKKIKALAKKYGLLQSGGSDFHGENKPGLDLATGYGRLHIHEEVLKKMKRARKAKILFTDLDGTLLTTEKTVSEKTRLKILDMIKNGNSLVFASGRPVDSILEVLDGLNIKEDVMRMQAENGSAAGGIYATAYNGAVLYDCIKGEAIQSYSVPIWAAQKLFDLAKERGIHIQTYADAHVVSIADDAAIKYYTRVIHLPYVIGENLEKELTHEPFKVLTIDLDDREKLERFRKEVENSELGAELACAFSNDYYLEFYNKNAGKGNALISMCRALNVLEQNAVAVGDEENDISMIAAAGVGVAMANANPALKKHADYITENDNNNDGMIEVIDKFMS